MQKKMCSKVDVQYFQNKKVKVMKEINKSSMCFCFSKSQLGSEKLGSSLFLLTGKIKDRVKHILMCFVDYFDLLYYM